MNCQLVFDAAATGFRAVWFPLFGLLFVIIGIVLVRFRRVLARTSPVGGSLFVWFFLLFSIGWTVIVSIATIKDYVSMHRALREGDVQVVEGVVRDFVPMPRTGHSMESFVVGGQRFEYSDYVVTSGFNNTHSHGGPITDGIYVRIAYRDGNILRLEICDPPDPVGNRRPPVTPLRTAEPFACVRTRLRMLPMSYEGIITIEPGKRGGQPCIRGMRITVYDVLSYLASGMSEDEVLADFPYLTREDILACLSYAAEREHRMLVANE